MTFVSSCGVWQQRDGREVVRVSTAWVYSLRFEVGSSWVKFSIRTQTDQRISSRVCVRFLFSTFANCCRGSAFLARNVTFSLFYRNQWTLPFATTSMVFASVDCVSSISEERLWRSSFMLRWFCRFVFPPLFCSLLCCRFYFADFR